MEFTIAEAKKEFSRILRETKEGPVVITRRGEPEAVVLAYADYEALRRLQAYQQILGLSRELRETGLPAAELYEASRRDLESRG